jgi:hypothetical protein
LKLYIIIDIISNFASPNYYDNFKNTFRYFRYIKGFKFVTKMIGKINEKILDIGCNGRKFYRKK